MISAEKTIVMNSPGDLKGAASQLLLLRGDKKVFAFYGEMGSGKTTLIKAICLELGVKDATSSPTFSMINEYHALSGEKFFHFDLYRLKNEAEAYDLGCEEYFYSGCYCFIEWPEKAEALLPANCLKVKVQVEGDSRVLSVGV